jgi:transcriptional regulator with XRE-family HTH domain
MATRESRAERGRRRGEQIESRLLNDLRSARVTADVSQRGMASLLGWSQTEYGRLEGGLTANVSIPDVAAAASILGLELSADLHPYGDPIFDRGHQALIKRFRDNLAPAFRVIAEVPLPTPGDRRSWDLLLRLDGQLIGVEAETRLRDMQALVRRIRSRERDGGVDEIVLVLSATRLNRRMVGELRTALGARFATSPRAIVGALRTGRPLPGSGAILV